MTPKEKARELVEEFQKQIFFHVTNERLDIEEAKGCALIAVDTVLWMASHYATIEYWQEVKQEIQAL